MSEVWESIQMASERGWKISFFLKDGNDFKEGFITHIDEENKAVLVERVGERHIQPTLIYANDVVETKLHW